MSYKQIQDVPPPPRRVRVSKTGRIIVVALGVMTALQMVITVGAIAVRHQYALLIYLATDIVIWLALYFLFYAREKTLLRDGVATTATISTVTGNVVAYRFSVGAVTYQGARRVAIQSAQMVRTGAQVAVVYDPASPARNLPITAATLMEIAR